MAEVRYQKINKADEKRRRSIRTMIEQFDIYKQFKIFCMANDMKISTGLEEAMRMYLDKYDKLRRKL